MDEAQRQAFEQFFASPPCGIDAEAVWREFRSLPPQYAVKSRRPPVPVWARRSFSEGGEAAWEMIQHDLAETENAPAMCVYLHIPFCVEKCTFCDCYSFRLRSNAARQIAAYSAALMKEIEVWGRSSNVKRRPVSTVHFGGGTPLSIGVQPFREIVEQIGSLLNISPATEWALETTSSALDESTFELLERQGFSRIHVGVQSLADPVRTLLHRQESASQVLEKIRYAVGKGWIVSVDLIYGLPQQSLESLVADVRLLAQNGVDGFSLYPLQVSSRNRGILQYYDAEGKDLLREYFMLLAAEQALVALGYRKTLFNHYARKNDANLYFSFPERGEDCLALGTIADGVFGSYHYRHPEYPQYLRGVSDHFPGLQGGMRRSPAEERLRLLEVMVLASLLREEDFAAVLGRQRAEKLFTQWQDYAIIRSSPGGAFTLTASGSWFAGAMLSQIACAY
jgi:anaerobilin synthase